MHPLLAIGLSNAVAASLLALAAGAVGYCGRRPAVAHGLWLLVLLKLLTPPLWNIPVSWPTSAGPAAAPPAAAFEAPVEPIPQEQEGPPAAFLFADEPAPFPACPEEPPASPPPSSADAPFPWQTLLLTLWGAGSAGWLTLSRTRIVRFQRLLRHARPAPPALQGQAECLAKRLGLARCPRVELLPGRLAPLLWAAWGRPRLLLPAGLLGRLSAEQQATLLAHELAHLRRRDHWVRAVELLATGLFWWHPVVWWARRELRECEEQCCDAWVVWALPEAGRAYATALVDTLDFLSAARAAAPALASGIGPVHDLKRRLTMIVRGTTPRSLTWTGCLGLVAAALLLLPLAPAWAQTDEIQKETDTRLRIERLKKELEELTRAQAKSVDKEQAEKVRAELKHAEAVVEQARAQLKQAEAAMRQAQERLAQLEGRGGAGVRKSEEKIILMIRDADGKTRTIELPPGTDVLRKIEGLVRGDVKKRIEFEIKPVPGTPGTPAPYGAGVRYVPVPPGAAPGDARLRELEMRIDALMKEMEALRRELRTPRPGEIGTDRPAVSSPLTRAAW